MRFIDSLSAPARLILDPAHLRTAAALLRDRFPDISLAVLRPVADGAHAILLHPTDARQSGMTVALPTAQHLDLLLGAEHSALVHAPYAEGPGLASLFPGVASLFLRRAFTPPGDGLLLAFAVDGIDTGFASQYDAALLTDRLRQRFDDLLMQSQVAVVRTRLEQQLNEVKTIKEKLLPAADHRVHGANYAVHYRPCSGGGGDYFEIGDVREARQRMGYTGDGDLWGVIIGDVSGHGPGAAVEVAMLDAILRTYEASPDFHPGHLLTYLNRHMFTRQIRGGFITSFQVIYDGAAGTLDFASAGHPAAVQKFAERARGARLLDCGGDIPLGIEPEHEWSSETASFGSRDMLVLYTDGASEARSPAGTEFGIEGIRQVVADSAATTPAALLADIVAALNRHTGNVPAGDDCAGDDCTIVVVQPAA